ncbi:LTA synthase family protein [Algibacter miyuki]|uniref:LTA synthase family protein n=1 Tax=Algibacter miyuki TaxID=1306933 RepID=A0ABV5H4F8_9FLAO|nr:sulfatase [Algibacter miyuki]MDN3663828.1 sulfatase [Algibacter miyuki]
MKNKNKLSYFCILLFLLINWCARAHEANNTEILSNFEVTHSNTSNDSSALLNTITKEIIYHAPESGNVNFVWGVEGFSNSELLSLNKNTKLLQGKLYTPMVLTQGVFKVSITLKKNEVIYFGFWITKNKSGVYTDFWDWKYNKTITFDKDTPITIEANYNLPQQKLNSAIITNGWIVLITLSILLLIVYFTVKKTHKYYPPVSVFSKILFLSLSMGLLHVMARAEIIGLHPKTLYTSPNNIFKLVKASTSDLLYVALFTTLFLSLFVIFKRKKNLTNTIYNICIGLAFLSVLIAFINITTVIYIGQPFNYEWLYYSDFLGSEDAKSALQQNLSVSIIFNLLALGLSLIVLQNIFKHLYPILLKDKKIKRTIIIVSSILAGFLFYQTKQAETIKDKGKTDNAILAMVSSFAKNDSDASFFSMELSDIDKTFIPNAGKQSITALDSSKINPIKNVIYIILESTGSKYFDLYGGAYQINPNLNKYANQALIFNNMYAHAPATNKSLTSILGGIYPNISYKSLTQEKPDFNHPTLSSILKNNGYATSFFSSANLDFLKSNTFLSYRGFDVVKDYRAINCSNQFKQNAYTEGDGIDDLCLAEQFELWLDEIDSKNFFSVLWTVQAHYPYFFSKEEIDFGVNNIEFNRYLNIIKHNDEMIGRILNVLKEKQLDKSTLVVVTGDHGEAFGQHQQYGHASDIYEENLRVPLLFINPELFSGQRTDDIASLKDLSTTTLSILDIDTPKTWQGRDLINTTHDEAFFFAPWSDYLFGYRKGKMKYIFNESTGHIEVYDLNLDPNETTNIINTTTPKAILHARTRIAAWVQHQSDFVNHTLMKSKN